MQIDIPVLYQDEHIIVVHKPSGLLVHKSMIDKHETEFLIQKLRDQIGKLVFLVHRLDKPTSGLMVLALNRSSAQALSESFANKLINKQYEAIVRGYVKTQLIDYPLVEKHDKMTDSKAKKNKLPQDAITKLELVKTAEIEIPLGRYQSARFSLVNLQPLTGRKHQLRRHLAHIRHPILGDTTHGDGKQNAFSRQQLGLHRLALIAKVLSFPHPASGKLMQFKTELDADLQASYQKLFT